MEQAPEYPFGLSDNELANLPSVFAKDVFVGKTLLVSGGGSGIGKACAWLAGRLGAQVVIVGRNAEKLAQTAGAMRAQGMAVDHHALNIRDPDAVTDVLGSMADRYNGIDGLINSAGGQFPQPAIDFSPNGWKAVVDTNLNGTWFMMQAAARLWRDAGRPGNIVNVVTVTDRGMPGFAHTGAARAGVINVSKSVAVEWAPLNIRVNCVAPGVIASEGMHVYSAEAREKFTDSNPMRRFGSSWEVAQTCVFLASDASPFITGDVITVDGGGRLWGELWPSGKPAEFY